MMIKFVRIDFDSIGDKIDLFLFENNPEKAQEISNVIKIAINESIQIIKRNFSDVEVLLIGADDILFSCKELYLEQLIELKEYYFSSTNLTVSIGVGNDIKEAIQNLHYAKVSGKNLIKGL